MERFPIAFTEVDAIVRSRSSTSADIESRFTPAMSVTIIYQVITALTTSINAINRTAACTKHTRLQHAPLGPRAQKDSLHYFSTHPAL
jgi:hypothetical protein